MNNQIEEKHEHIVDINEFVKQTKHVLFSKKIVIARELDKFYPNSKFTNMAIAEKLCEAGIGKIPENSVLLTKSEYERLSSGEKTFNQVVRILVERFVGIICKDATEIALPGGYSDMVFVEDIKDKAVAIIRGELDVFDEGKKGGSN